MAAAGLSRGEGSPSISNLWHLVNLRRGTSRRCCSWYLWSGQVHLDKFRERLAQTHLLPVPSLPTTPWDRWSVRACWVVCAELRYESTGTAVCVCVLGLTNYSFPFGGGRLVIDNLSGEYLPRACSQYRRLRNVLQWRWDIAKERGGQFLIMTGCRLAVVVSGHLSAGQSINLEGAPSQRQWRRRRRQWWSGLLSWKVMTRMLFCLSRGHD